MDFINNLFNMFTSNFLSPFSNLKTIFVSSGKDADLKWFKEQLSTHYELKTQVLGPGKEDERSSIIAL